METANQTVHAITNKLSNDLYQQVTNTIIGQLENGVIPWQKPWAGGGNKVLGLPFNFTTGKYYKGINIVLLWGSAIKNNFTTDEWAGFYQWKDKNETIKTGEKGTVIVYYNTVEKEIDGEKQKIPFLKSSYVFNRCQLTSYNPETEEQEYAPSLVEKIGHADEFITNTKAIIEQYDGGAKYNFVSDKIFLPYSEKFQPTETCTATEGFYSTLLHELVHWSGAKHRLNREKGTKFGDQAYATEELTAEFGSAFLCAWFEFATLEKGDHAGYIENWLKVFKENKKIIFTAASEASKAVEYLHSLQPQLI